MQSVLKLVFLLCFSFRFGTFGYMAEYGAEKKVSKYSSVVASVSVGQPTGVIMKVKYVQMSMQWQNCADIVFNKLLLFLFSF